jgi:hypothetical protein
MRFQGNGGQRRLAECACDVTILAFENRHGPGVPLMAAGRRGFQ